jgi:hypothetical protein
VRAESLREGRERLDHVVEHPYHIRRKDGSHEARRELTQHISDIRSRISFYTAWMQIQGTPAVAAA